MIARELIDILIKLNPEYSDVINKLYPMDEVIARKECFAEIKK